jgi:hypothetical protein
MCWARSSLQNNLGAPGDNGDSAPKHTGSNQLSDTPLEPSVYRDGRWHTVPSIETFAKYAQALEIPLYQLFYDGEEAPKKIKGVDLDGAKLSNSERREIESLGGSSQSLKRGTKALYGSSLQSLRRQRHKAHERKHSTPIEAQVSWLSLKWRSDVLRQCRFRPCGAGIFKA